MQVHIVFHHTGGEYRQQSCLVTQPDGGGGGGACCVLQLILRWKERALGCGVPCHCRGKHQYGGRTRVAAVPSLC